MKMNTNGVGVQPEQQKETRTNLFAGSISCDQGEDGRVELSGQFNLTPAGRQFIATAFAAAANYITGRNAKVIDCDTEDDDE